MDPVTHFGLHIFAPLISLVAFGLNQYIMLEKIISMFNTFDSNVVKRKHFHHHHELYL